MKRIRNFVALTGLVLCALVAGPSFAAQDVGGIDVLGTHHTNKQSTTGSLLTLPDVSTTDWNSGPITLSNGTSTLLIASAPNVPTATANAQRRYVINCQVSTLAATTAVTLSLLDHTTVLWTIGLPAGASIYSFKFDDLLKTAAGATNHELNAQLSGSPTGNVTVNCQGHTRP